MARSRIHESNPLIEENRRTVTQRVLDEKADIGIAWDGDADRCFFIDGTGDFVAGDFVTALLAEAFLIKYPGEKILYDVRASYAVKDIVAQYGGTALMSRVGHAFIKQRMRAENAIFGGEVTGHYYFRDNFFADNGFIPVLLILELMSRKGKTLAELLAPLREKYFISGEINTKLASMELADAKIDAITSRYADGHVYHLDGVSVEYPDWHLNVRKSNTEPLLRLNLEGVTQRDHGTAPRRGAGIDSGDSIEVRCKPDSLQAARGHVRTTKGRPRQLPRTALLCRCVTCYLQVEAIILRLVTCSDAAHAGLRLRRHRPHRRGAAGARSRRCLRPRRYRCCRCPTSPGPSSRCCHCRHRRAAAGRRRAARASRRCWTCRGGCPRPPRTACPSPRPGGRRAWTDRWTQSAIRWYTRPPCWPAADRSSACPAVDGMPVREPPPPSVTRSVYMLPAALLAEPPMRPAPAACPLCAVAPCVPAAALVLPAAPVLPVLVLPVAVLPVLLVEEPVVPPVMLVPDCRQPCSVTD